MLDINQSIYNISGAARRLRMIQTRQEGRPGVREASERQVA
jgi:hypothetical protein